MSSHLTVIIILAALIISLTAAIASFESNKNNPLQDALTPLSNRKEETIVASPTPVASTKYQDGTYTKEGSYTSPAGKEAVKVTLTLSKDNVTAAEVVALAKHPTSQSFQGEFVQNFRPAVIGKNIDELNLTKIAGSSLTPKGFTDALEQIKTAAQF